ncbi:hypothetical protein [Allobaculum sp. JKK-2023]|uniref:hypothetical protein n=1 Tax=Allobaculum sp. JKK-2023 TaxID=3108943 RepID=UPI002B052D79|nr:hypothetical protein [Allobaculum sp. JKK-2023]
MPRKKSTQTVSKRKSDPKEVIDKFSEILGFNPDFPFEEEEFAAVIYDPENPHLEISHASELFDRILHDPSLHNDKELYKMLSEELSPEADVDYQIRDVGSVLYHYFDGCFEWILEHQDLFTGRTFFYGLNAEFLAAFTAWRFPDIEVCWLSTTDETPDDPKRNLNPDTRSFPCLINDSLSRQLNLENLHRIDLANPSACGSFQTIVLCAVMNKFCLDKECNPLKEPFPPLNYRQKARAWFKQLDQEVLDLPDLLEKGGNVVEIIHTEDDLASFTWKIKMLELGMEIVPETHSFYDDSGIVPTEISLMAYTDEPIDREKEIQKLFEYIRTLPFGFKDRETIRAQWGRNVLESFPFKQESGFLIQAENNEKVHGWICTGTLYLPKPTFIYFTDIDLNIDPFLDFNADEQPLRSPLLEMFPVKRQQDVQAFFEKKMTALRSSKKYRITPHQFGSNPVDSNPYEKN